MGARQENYEGVYKNNQWLNYKGTVEYYVCDDYPSAYDIWTKRPHYYSGLLHNSLNLIYWNYHDDQWNKRPVKRVKMQADIRIAPFKKSPKHIMYIGKMWVWVLL